MRPSTILSNRVKRLSLAYVLSLSQFINIACGYITGSSPHNHRGSLSAMTIEVEQSMLYRSKIFLPDPMRCLDCSLPRLKKCFECLSTEAHVGEVKDTIDVIQCSVGRARRAPIFSLAGRNGSFRELFWLAGPPASIKLKSITKLNAKW
jgi:hypothetical protein